MDISRMSRMVNMIIDLSKVSKVFNTEYMPTAATASSSKKDIKSFINLKSYSAIKSNKYISIPNEDKREQEEEEE